MLGSPADVLNCTYIRLMEPKTAFLFSHALSSEALVWNVNYLRKISILL